MVADRGLGLTPLIFLAAGLLFVLATLSFAEGGAMFLDRGGSANLARHAFNELIAFIAAWALLIDFILVIALAAVSAPHYLSPIWDGFAEGTGEVLTAVGIVVAVALVNIAGWLGLRRQGLLVALAIGDLAVQVLLIVVGVAVVFEPSALTENLDLFTSPSLEDAIYALVIATVAFAGIEAAADLAPDLEWDAPALRRSVTAGAALLPILYAGVAAVALMAVPGGDRAERAGDRARRRRTSRTRCWGSRRNFDPQWVSDAMQVAVVAVAPAVLVWAASTAMLGLSRHVYVLATNRQIPSWLGKLGRRRGTPHVAILAAAAIAIGLVIPGDIEMLAGIYAFGATLSIAIAHAAVLRMRRTRPARSAAVPGAVRRPGGRGRRADAGGDRVRPDRAGVDQRAGVPRRGALGRRRLDGVRAGRLRDLPEGVRGDDADEAGGGAGGGADQAGGGRRVRGHPGADLRDRARRRHRQHGRAGSRTRRSSRASASRGCGSST